MTDEQVQELFKEIAKSAHVVTVEHENVPLMRRQQKLIQGRSHSDLLERVRTALDEGWCVNREFFNINQLWAIVEHEEPYR